MSDSLNIYKNIILLMVRSKHRMLEVCEPYKITPIQGLLLILLEPDDQKSMNELSELMICDASNITGLVDRLEAHGYITRKEDKKDRRLKIIKLTTKGEKRRDNLLSKLNAKEMLDLSLLNKNEQKTLSSLIAKLLT